MLSVVQVTEFFVGATVLLPALLELSGMTYMAVNLVFCRGQPAPGSIFLPMQHHARNRNALARIACRPCHRDQSRSRALPSPCKAFVNNGSHLSTLGLDYEIVLGKSHPTNLQERKEIAR